MESSFIVVKYGVGLDVGKLNFHACISAIDHTQRIKIKATHCFANSPKGITDFVRWAIHHCKDNKLPVQYLMEATGIYYEQLAMALHSRQLQVSVILPARAAPSESQLLY